MQLFTNHPLEVDSLL